MTGAHNDLRHDLIVVVIPGLAANLSTAEIGFDHSPYVVSSLGRFKLLGFDCALPYLSANHMEFRKHEISKTFDKFRP